MYWRIVDLQCFISRCTASESVVHIHGSTLLFFKFFSHRGHYRVWSSVPWATQHVLISYPFCLSVRFSHSVVSDSLWPHGLQHVRLPCLSPTPGACSNSYLLSWWYHPTISFSVIPFSSCLQSFPASGSFLMSWFFASGGWSIGASASILPVNIQYLFPSGLTGWISLQSKGLSRVFSNTTFLGAPKITTYDDCSLEIKTLLAPWKKSYDQPRQHIKKQIYYFANKGLSSQGYGFSR